MRQFLARNNKEAEQKSLMRILPHIVIRSSIHSLAFEQYRFTYKREGYSVTLDNGYPYFSQPFSRPKWKTFRNNLGNT
jgi:uncharacterized membrane protein